MAAQDQQFEPEHDGGGRDIAYFPHAFTTDAFDLTIRQVPDDEPNNAHAKVEIVFLQDKGNRKREVVTAVAMQLNELNDMMALIKRKVDRFNDVAS